MADDTGAAPDPQAGDGSGTNPQPPAGAPNPQAGTGETDSISLEKAKELRQEAAALRKRLKAFEDAEEARKQGEMTELQKLQADIDKKNGDLAARDGELRTLKAAQAASRAGAVDPELIAAQLSSEDLADAKATDAAIGRLREKFPRQFLPAHGSGDGGAGNGARSATGTSMNTIIRRGAGRET